MLTGTSKIKLFRICTISQRSAFQYSLNSWRVTSPLKDVLNCIVILDLVVVFLVCHHCHVLLVLPKGHKVVVFPLDEIVLVELVSGAAVVVTRNIVHSQPNNFVS